MLTFDKSKRSFDGEGRLRLDSNPISKACVNDYFGDEIPDAERLGLDPKRTYSMLRHPDELKKAADSFNGVQVLMRHIGVDAENPQKEAIIGAMGNDVTFDGQYLRGFMIFWDSEAIAMIEKETQCELSSSYTYDADMTSGIFEGARYDGVMRNIKGNHVALVVEGRVGSDVRVMDEKPKRQIMKLTEGQKAKISAKLAKDENINVEEVLKGVEEVLAEATEDPEKEALDEEETEPDIKAILKSLSDRIEMLEGKKASDEYEEEKGKEPTKKDDKAMDAATIKRIVDKAVKENGDALTRARALVAPIAGGVVCDSVEATYDYVLAKRGIVYDGKSLVQKEAMIEGIVSVEKQKLTPVKRGNDAKSGMMSVLGENIKRRL